MKCFGYPPSRRFARAVASEWLQLIATDSSAVISFQQPGTVDKALTASMRNDGSVLAHYYVFMDGNMALFHEQLFLCLSRQPTSRCCWACP